MLLDLPTTADIVDNSLIFYDSRFALAQCELHPDQTPNSAVTDAIEIWADDFEDGAGEFFRVRPETLKILAEDAFPERGASQIYFDRDDNRQFILDDLPGLNAEIERRAYLRAVERWERHPAQFNDGDLPNYPVYEPARDLYDAWQAALAEHRANGFRDFAKVEVAYAAYRDARPKTKGEIALEGTFKRSEPSIVEKEPGHKQFERILESNTYDKVTFEDFWCYSPAHSYIFVPTGEHWPAATIDARLAPVHLNGRPKATIASKFLTEFRAVDQATWAPGKPQVIDGKLISDGGWFDRLGSRTYNLYRPPTIKPRPGDASPWIDHVHRIYPDEADHIIQWLAQRVQCPDQKINHALVLGGYQGIGKDTMLEPIKHAVGPWNCAEVSPQQVLGRFNSFVKSVVLRVSEARDLGDTDRFAFYEHLKTLTAAPPDVLRCDEKHLREHSVLNVCGVIMTTNNKDALHLPADDRRHFVAWSDRRKEEFSAEYWSTLWKWFHDGGNEIVTHYLATLDISDFDAKAPPPKTKAFWEIVDASRAPEDAEMADALDAIGNPDAATVVAVMFRATPGFGEWLRDRKNRRKIGHRFEACGYVVVRNPDDRRDGQWKIAGKRQTVYVKRDLSVRDQIAAAQRLAMGAPPY